MTMHGPIHSASYDASACQHDWSTQVDIVLKRAEQFREDACLHAGNELPSNFEDVDHYRRKAAGGIDYECGVIDALTFVIDLLSHPIPIHNTDIGDPQ